MSIRDQCVDLEVYGGPEWLPRQVTVDLGQIVSGILGIPLVAAGVMFVFSCRVRRTSGAKSVTVSCGQTMAVG